MDALVRRCCSGTFAAMIALGGFGCGLLGRDVDRDVEATLRDSKLPTPRAQAPLVLPPPQQKPAPVVPLDAEPAKESGVLPLPASRPQESKPTPIESQSPSGVEPAAAKSTVSAQPLERLSAKPQTQVKVVATIGTDVIITEDEVSMMMKQRAMDYVQLKGDGRSKKEKDIYREELKKLIERELLLNDFLAKVKKNKPQLIDELWERAARMTDDNLRGIRKRFGLKTEADFTAEMERQGMSYRMLRRHLEREAMVTQFLGGVLREKQGTPTVADVQAYYDQHKDEFQSEDRVKYLHIFVAKSRFETETEAKRYADGLWQKARQGADFAKLAKDSGHGDSALREGQGIGEKRGDIRPAEIEATVFDTKPGNIGAVIPAENGYHIVKVLERDVAGLQKFDEKLQSEIRNKLMGQAMKVERDKIVQALWRTTGVTTLEP